MFVGLIFLLAAERASVVIFVVSLNFNYFLLSQPFNHHSARLDSVNWIFPMYSRTQVFTLMGLWVFALVGVQVLCAHLWVWVYGVKFVGICFVYVCVCV